MFRKKHDGRGRYVTVVSTPSTRLFFNACCEAGTNYNLGNPVVELSESHVDLAYSWGTFRVFPDICLMSLSPGVRVMSADSINKIFTAFQAILVLVNTLLIQKASTSISDQNKGNPSA